jgi:hypothetical protein
MMMSIALYCVTATTTTAARSRDCREQHLRFPSSGESLHNRAPMTARRADAYAAARAAGLQSL